MIKLSCLILLMVLVNFSWAQSAEIITCSGPGVYAHASDCRLYQECVFTGSAGGRLQLVTKSCNKREAFSSELKRCSREISSCKPSVECKKRELVEDPLDNTSYHFCQPKFSGPGFYIFRIYTFRNNSDFRIIKAEINNLRNQYNKELKKRN